MPALGAALQSIPQAISCSIRVEIERFGLCARSDAAQGLQLGTADDVVDGTADDIVDSTVDDIVDSAADRAAGHTASHTAGHTASRTASHTASHTVSKSVSKAVRDAMGHEELPPRGVPRRRFDTHLNLGAGVLRAPDLRGRLQGESVAGLGVSSDSDLTHTDINFHPSPREWS